MMRFFVGLMLVLIFTGYKASSQILDAGVRFQKSINLYYENGVAATYSPKNLMPDKLYFGLSYVTSRLGSAYHSNAIKQDNYLFSASYIFRPKHLVRPFLGAGAGYFYADYGDPMFNVLPHTSLIADVNFGIRFETHTPFKVDASLGYNLVTGNGLSGPGTLYPVFYQVTLLYTIFKNQKK